MVSLQTQNCPYKLFLALSSSRPQDKTPSAAHARQGLVTLLHCSGHTPAGVSEDSGSGHFAKNTSSHSRKHLECVLSSRNGDSGKLCKYTSIVRNKILLKCSRFLRYNPLDIYISFKTVQHLKSGHAFFSVSFQYICLLSKQKIAIPQFMLENEATFNL